MNCNKQKQPLSYGEILAVDYGYYQHFGVYIGNEQVIHYAPLEENRGENLVIHITSMELFKRGEEEIYSCDFGILLRQEEKQPSETVVPKQLRLLLTPKLNWESGGQSGTITRFLTSKYKIYEEDEVVQRAYSRLGELCFCNYNNRCEHFAIWCKTGVSNEEVANNIIKLVKSNWKRI